jgi:hypothetical protein
MPAIYICGPIDEGMLLQPVPVALGTKKIRIQLFPCNVVCLQGPVKFLAGKWTLRL